MENTNKNVWIALAAGAAAGVAIGYYLAQRKEPANNKPITGGIIAALAEVALAKGMDALNEIVQKYNTGQQEKGAEAA